MSDVLLEIGIEELPARFIDDGQRQLEAQTQQWLKDNNIAYHYIRSYATPRRLAVIIEDIADEQTTTEAEVRGPKMAIAKDENDAWTKAAIGFTKGQGKTVDDIYTKTIGNDTYVFINKTTIGKKTSHLLPELKTVIDALQFPQTMRWGSNDYRFPRPLRWLTALYGEAVIPFEIAGVQTSNTSRGHRFLGEDVVITNPNAYEALLQEQYVVVDPQKRESLILEGIQAIEAEHPFHIEVDPDLLEEVRNLVEYPTVFFGTFEQEFLKLPSEVLITSMKEHQRYFPVFNKEQDELLSFFVSVRNGDDVKIGNVIRGNEKVLRARLQDAAFFYEEDQQHSIEHYTQKLEKVVFQEKIGTMAEKTAHTHAIAAFILDALQTDAKTVQTTIRAADIAKFDLVTNMVNEFTELQGIMGEKYALIFGEDNQTAKAIKEHYMPVQAKGNLPESIQGAIVSVADKLDTIVSCFAVGLHPTGSQDPLGLRRQATGVLRILLETKWDIQLESLIEKACEVYGVIDEQVSVDVAQFFRDRVVYLLEEEQLDTDVVRAVISETIGTFYYAMEKATLLSHKKHEEDFKSVQEALVRVINIAKKANGDIAVDPTLFETASERALYNQYSAADQDFREADDAHNATKALQALTGLTDNITAFFDDNMVMAEDEKVKNNRLALMSHLSQIIANYADLSAIAWKQHQ